MSSHNELGKKGEEIAQAYLRNKGYDILHTNWHAGHLELDIVAQYEGELVVVEVKTRSDLHFGDPEDAITIKKVRLIVRATHYYIKEFQVELPARFDIITVVFMNGNYQLEHLEDAFYPPLR